MFNDEGLGRAMSDSYNLEQANKANNKTVQLESEIDILKQRVITLEIAINYLLQAKSKDSSTLI